MPCFNLTIKLPPARKSWKIISNKLQSNLQKLKSSSAYKKITHSRFVSHKKSSLGSRFTTPTHHKYYLHHHHHQAQKSFMTIFVDELYDQQEKKNKGKQTSDVENKQVMNKERVKVRGETSSMHHSVKAEYTHKVDKDLDEKGTKRKGKVGEKSKYSSVDDAWNALIASSPQFRGVDERAEEFISKFKQDMKLQKEKSLLEFEEMLARGA